MKEFSKSNLLSRAIEIRPKNELVGHLSELSLLVLSGTSFCFLYGSGDNIDLKDLP